MINAMKSYLKAREIEQTELRRFKYNEILKTLEAYYRDLEMMKKTEIPYFLRAENEIKKVIKTNSDIDYYYNRLMKWKKEQTKF